MSFSFKSPVNVSPVVCAPPPDAITPSTQFAPSYTFNLLADVLKYKSPSATALPPPSVVGLDAAT